MNDDIQENDRPWADYTWTIEVCPVCMGLYPHHNRVCRDSDPPTLRPDFIRYKVVSAAWRDRGV
jgi:hypothetical protein